MTQQDFYLLCSLNASRPNTLGWTEEQAAVICRACSEANFDEPTMWSEIRLPE